MSKYTINDVSHIIPVEQTKTVTIAVEEYLNSGTIPDYDPCFSCEPNHIRKLISLIQVAERNGLWPPARTEVEPKPRAKEKAKAPEVTEPSGEGGEDDPEVDFTEVFKDK